MSAKTQMIGEPQARGLDREGLSPGRGLSFLDLIQEDRWA